MMRPDTYRCALLLPILAAALGGCGEAASGAAGAAVRDSAGIQIVENALPAWGEGEGWRLSDTPVLEIGMGEGRQEYLLFGVGAARRLTDGTVAIANSGSNEIRFFDPSSAHLRSIGGRGDGPGEFRRLSWMELLPGDSLLAYDQQARRLSTFTQSGEFVRSTTLAGDSEGGFPEAFGAFEDGSLLVRMGRVVPASEVESGVIRSSLPFVHYSAEGELRDSIATLPGPESYLEASNGSISILPLLLGRSASAAVAGDRVYLGASDSFDIGLYTSTGTLERLIRRQGGLVPVTATEIQLVRAEQLERIGQGPWRAGQERMLAEMPEPETRPAFASFVADDEGNLWVEESRIPGEPVRWTVFDTEGVLLGTLELPDQLRPLHIGEDFILGVTTDELDVQRVRMYGLIKD